MDAGIGTALSVCGAACGDELSEAKLRVSEEYYRCVEKLIKASKPNGSFYNDISAQAAPSLKLLRCAKESTRFSYPCRIGPEFGGDRTGKPGACPHGRTPDLLFHGPNSTIMWYCLTVLCSFAIWIMGCSMCLVIFMIILTMKSAGAVR